MSSQKTIWDEFKDHEFAHAYFDEYLNTYVATQLKVLREQRQLKQGDLARLAGMAQERISVMENVNYSSWTVNTLRRLAKALGVRLRVSFETFGSGLQEMRNFIPENLKRDSLQDELDQRFGPSAERARTKSQALLEAYSVTRNNGGGQSALDFPSQHIQVTFSKDHDETSDDQPSASDLAVHALGFKPQRKNLGEERAH